MSIYQRGKGWAVLVEKRRVRAGKRVRVYEGGFDTKREAKDREAAIRTALKRGEHVDPSRITLGEYLVDRWLPAQRAQVRPNTWETYRTYCVATIIPALGGHRLQDLRPEDLDAFYADLLTAGGRAAGASRPRRSATSTPPCARPSRTR